MTRLFLRSVLTILCVSMVMPALGLERIGQWKVTSPDGALSVNVSLTKSDNPESPRAGVFYRVERKGEEVLPAAQVGLTLKRFGAFQNLRFLSESTRTVDEWYEMPVGKKSRCHNSAHELTLELANDTNGKMSLIFRACNDGIAYRYKIQGTGKDTVVGETSSFHIPAGSSGLFAKYADPHYEWEFVAHDDISGIDFPIGVPALFHTPRNQWVFVTEADVQGTYAGARLQFADAKNGILRIELPEQPTSDLPWTTPWRVALIGTDLKTIVESTLIADLNPPSEIAETSWIKPGVAIFPWATGTKTNNSSLERMKQFVDVAKEMGWTWIEFDNALVFGKQTGDNPRRWMAVKWIPELVQYATSQGINVYGWDHWNHLDTPAKRELILGYLAKNGFKGIKVDFLTSDSQKLFEFRDVIAKECADRKLMLSYHGETMPRGQQRRWPHIATLEGVKGEENYIAMKGTGPTPVHNVNLVFTRNIPGSMDYTPSGFELTDRITTNAHEMALPVVFESGWQCMCVSPESMKDNPARGFLQHLPAAWDDVHFVDGQPGQFAVLARRKGPDWWLAGINAKQAREVKIPLGFLKPGSCKVNLYRDAPEQDAKAPVMVEERTIDTAQPLVVSMPANGGFGVKFENMARESDLRRH